MRKMRKFEIGGMASDDDALEAKYKAAGLAASNAEKKSSGFLGLGRFLEGNIDQKGSEAYNKYGAGYGRKLEAENDRLKAATLRDTAAPAETKPAAPVASAPAPAPAAAAKYRGSSDYSDTADMKRNQGSAAATSAKPAAAATAVTKVVEDMPKTRPAGGAQVATGDARVAEYANAFPSSDMKRNQGSAAAKPPAAKPPAAKPPAAKPPAAKTTSPTQRGGREEDKAVPKAPAAKTTSPTRRDGREEDKAPEAAKPAAAEKPLSQAVQRAQAATARATGNSSGAASYAPTAAEAERNRARFAGKAGDAVSSVGNFFKSYETPPARRSRLAKEAKAKETASFNRERGDRAKGGAIRGYASGGSVSASSRGDGIAQRGKTRGKMC